MSGGLTAGFHARRTSGERLGSCRCARAGGLGLLLDPVPGRNHPPTQRPYGQILELSATPGAEPPALRSNPAPQPVGGERSKRISGLHPGWHSHFGADLD